MLATMHPITWRAYNINEVNIFENGFLNEFKNAQESNFAPARGGTGFAPSSVAGLTCLAAPALLDKFFTGLSAATSGYASTTFFNNLRDNNVGALCQYVGVQLSVQG